MTSLHFIALLIFIGSVSCNQEPGVEFVEPLKNITATLGSNLEFSCSVLHLNSFRVIWFHKDSILAINGLKVTRNPRISFSVIPRSGDVTESILYIFNVGYEDGGNYTCAVNTEPMIRNKGSLDVSMPKSKEPITDKPTTQSPQPIPTLPPPPQDPPKSATSSDIFCINFPKIWKDTKKEAENFVKEVKEVWKKFSDLF